MVRVKVISGICEIVIHIGHQSLQYRWGVILKAFRHCVLVFLIGEN